LRVFWLPAAAGTQFHLRRRASDIAEVVDVVRGGIRPWSPTKERPEFSGSVGHQMVEEEETEGTPIHGRVCQAMFV